MDIQEENGKEKQESFFYPEEDLKEEAIKEKINRKIFQKTVFILVLILLSFGNYFWGYKNGEKHSTELKPVSLLGSLVENKNPDFSIEKVDFSLYWKVWDLVKKKHVNKAELDAQKMVYGSIKGMLKATGDPYSDFFDPKETTSFSQEIEGSFEGIGAELTMKNDILTVIAPLEGSPAQKSGLRAGDKILKVGDKIIADFSIEEAVNLIRGPKNTEVKMTILSEGDNETKEISITRMTITLDSVVLEFKENQVAYLKINQFSQDTDKEFSRAVEKIIAQKSPGIILDLRNNPGGLLDKSISIASYLIPENKVVVIEEDSAGKKDNLNTLGGDKLSHLPIVVLIDKGSASASEILAGALKDNRGITLIGEKSFGKGSVQQLMDLPGGSSVKITVAKWLTPKGEYIMEKGIEPDIKVEMTREDYEKKRDPQLEKASEILSEKINKN